MASNETGWTKEWPVVNGIYWARWQSTVSVNTFIVEVIGKRFYMTGRSLICPNHETPAPYEWLGPISPSDAEQLMELRRALLSIERAAPACECEHNNEYCCAVVGEFCAMCWAHAALNPDLPKETQ